ncbi:MAG TPA: DUF2244 domain-containing protein [Thiolinea sp.]|nr:DUF2244 domain-containing protein [Thiolinea sp.]
MPREFVIQPNCSLATDSKNSFLWGIGLIMLAITLLLVSKGLWLVAPFMGLDLLLLVYAFNRVGRQCRITERVIVDRDSLTVLHEEKHHPRSWSFPVHWVNVDLRQDHHPWYKSSLLIGTHGQWIRLADFLDNEERASLAKAIREAIMEARQPEWLNLEPKCR